MPLAFMLTGKKITNREMPKIYSPNSLSFIGATSPVVLGELTNGNLITIDRAGKTFFKKRE